MAARLCFLVVMSACLVLADQRPSYGGGGGGGGGGRGGGSSATIVKDERTQNAYGEYTFNYETSDGTVRQGSGTQNDGQNSQGGWMYTSPEGQNIEINFVADSGGYQPRGAVLPVAPALPYKRIQQFIH